MNALTLPPGLGHFTDEAVATGRFRDVGEVVRAGVSLLQRLEQLQEQQRAPTHVPNLGALRVTSCLSCQRTERAGSLGDNPPTREQACSQYGNALIHPRAGDRKAHAEAVLDDPSAG
jgi:Arc/MetJ-type ribon-helix-helix transcriptional regulator